MTVLVEIGDEIVVSVLDGTITLDATRLPADVLVTALLHGFKQKINDAHASEKDDEKAFALAEKAANKLYDGWIVRATGPRNPVRARAITIALRYIDKKITDAKERRAAAIKAVAKNAAYMELAFKHIEEEKDLGVYDESADDVSPEADE